MYVVVERCHVASSKLNFIPGTAGDDHTSFLHLSFNIYISGYCQYIIFVLNFFQIYFGAEKAYTYPYLL